MEPGPLFSWSVDLNFGFATAAVLSLITFGVHTFVGGKYVARPLLASNELPKASLWLNYFTWHMATVMLLFMAGGYAFAASRPDAADVAALIAALVCTSAAMDRSAWEQRIATVRAGARRCPCSGSPPNAASAVA